jgi:hypothetical protein
MRIFQQLRIDWTETPESKINIIPRRIPCSFWGRHNHGKQKERGRQDDPAHSSRSMGLRRLVAGVLTLVALALPVRAVVMPPGTQVVLSWPSLGSGTTYYVQTSTDLLTWATAAITTATSVTMSLQGNTMCVFRLVASNASPQSATLACNASPQSVTLAWNPSVSTGVIGYYLYYGTATGNYTEQIDAGLATSAVVNGLQAGATYYFATTGYDSVGDQSACSNEVVWHCPLLLNIQQLP